MRSRGEYPTRAEMINPNHNEEPINVSFALERCGKFIEHVLASGDKVSIAAVAMLRIIHETERMHVSVRISDKVFVDRVVMPFWLPVYRGNGKFLYTQICAQQISEQYSWSEELMRHSRQLFTHALVGSTEDLSTLTMPEVEALLSNRETDYLNERHVDAFKTSQSDFATMLAPSAERSALALRGYEHLRTNATELFATQHFARSSKAHISPSNRANVLVGAACFSAAKVWACWPGRDALHDPLALVHYLSLCNVSASALSEVRCVVSGAPVSGLPQLVASQKEEAGSVGSSSGHFLHEATKAVVRGQASSGDELPHGLIVVAVRVGAPEAPVHRLVPLQSGARPSGIQVLVQTLALYEFDPPLAMASRLSSCNLTLFLHSPSDAQSTEASLLRPLLSSKAVESPAKAEKAAAKQRADEETQFYSRLINDVNGSGAIMAQTSSKADAKKISSVQLHTGLPAWSVLMRVLDEKLHTAATEAYINETFIPAQREREKRHEAVLKVIDELAASAGGALPRPTQQKSAEALDLQRQLSDLRRRVERAEQLRSRAIALRLGREDPLVIQGVQQQANDALMDVLAARLRLENHKLVVARTTRATFRNDSAVSGMDYATPDAMYERLKALAKKSDAGMAHLVSIVRDDPPLQLTPRLRKQVDRFEQRQRDGASPLAPGRAQRATAGRPAGATYPVGAQVHAFGIGEVGRYDASLLKRRVVVASALCGLKAGAWLEGTLLECVTRRITCLSSSFLSSGPPLITPPPLHLPLPPIQQVSRRQLQGPKVSQGLIRDRV